MTQKSSRDEAQKIYFALFRAECPERIHHLYDLSLSKIENTWTHDEWSKGTALLSSTNQTESIEFAARLLRRYPNVSMRFRLMCLLEETRENSFLKLQPENRLWVILGLLWAPFAAAGRAVVGIVLIKKFEACS